MTNPSRLALLVSSLNITAWDEPAPRRPSKYDLPFIDPEVGLLSEGEPFNSPISEMDRDVATPLIPNPAYGTCPNCGAYGVTLTETNPPTSSCPNGHAFVPFAASSRSAGKHAPKLRQWTNLSYPEKAQHSYDRNIHQRDNFGFVSPWLNIETKTQARADLLQVSGEIGKGSFTLVLKVKDETDSFLLTEAKISKRAQMILEEFSNATPGETLFPTPQIETKLHQLHDLTRKAYQYWLEKYAGGT